MKLHSQKGMTLIELLVASTVGVFIILGSATMLLQFTKASWYSRYSAEESAEVQLASYTMNKYLSGATNVDWTTGNIANIGANRGRLRIFDSGFHLGVTPAPVTTVGVFLREAGYPSATNTGSDIRATALYFQNPSELVGGRLLISTSPPGFGNVTLSSNTYTVMFDNIVEFQLGSAGLVARDGDPVRVVKLEIVFRRFRDPNKSQWRFCPASEMARPSCQTLATYVDEKITLDVPLVNNEIPTDFGTQETLYGNIYFYGLGVKTQ